MDFDLPSKEGAMFMPTMHRTSSDSGRASAREGSF
jgi:hypothetical protein